jgi:hypothetical protein
MLFVSLSNQISPNTIVPFINALTRNLKESHFNSFFIGIVWGGAQLGPLGTAATNKPIVPPPGYYDNGEIGGMIGRGNRSTLRKPAPVPLCPSQTPHAAQTRTRAAAVGSQRLTAWAMARPKAKSVLRSLANMHGNHGYYNDKQIMWYSSGCDSNSSFPGLSSITVVPRYMSALE